MDRIVLDEITDIEDRMAVMRLDLTKDLINATIEDANQRIGGTPEPLADGIPVVWPNIRLGED